MKRIIFLHHSTGNNIFMGKTNRYLFRLGLKGTVEKYFDDYNLMNDTEYLITDRLFPKSKPYGWKNYPFDYYNIWVKHGGPERYMDEPTLEILAAGYDVIIFKHCFPVGRIKKNTGIPDISSEEKRLENYKLQYNALKQKMHSFPDTRFIVWTPPALLENLTTPDQAMRTYEFYRWIIDDWNEKGDNIFVWDFYRYETEDSLYMRNEYARAAGDPHPGKEFSGKVAPLFSRFIIETIRS